MRVCRSHFSGLRVWFTKSLQICSGFKAYSLVTTLFSILYFYFSDCEFNVLPNTRILSSSSFCTLDPVPFFSLCANALIIFLMSVSPGNEKTFGNYFLSCSLTIAGFIFFDEFLFPSLNKETRMSLL